MQPTQLGREKVYDVIWVNWYGRKQERQLLFGTANYERKFGDEVRASHAYTAIEKVEYDQGGKVVVNFLDKTREHYFSSVNGAKIVEAFKKHCSVAELPKEVK